MVRTQIEARGISTPRVLAAMRAVPRDQFVPDHLRAEAYEDRPLPIAAGQTISQPFVVAAMTDLAKLEPTSRVLEIGTGSGYQTAVLATLAAEVYTIEIIESLARRAENTLLRLGFDGIHFRVGDGHAGWPEVAPFDAIIVTAAPAEVPAALLSQLAIGGRLVIPVGEADQELLEITRGPTGFQRRSVFPVRFVPMTH